MGNPGTDAALNPGLNVELLDIPPMAFRFGFNKIRNNMVYLIDTVKTTRNWYDVLLLRFRFRGSARITFSDGRAMLLDKKSYPQYAQIRFAMSRHMPLSFNDGNKAEFAFEGRPLTLEGDNVLGNVFEIFFSEAYAPLGCRGKTVVDVGANIGDTAIYFALRGAKRVFAVEPFRNLFIFGKRNVEANGLQKQVTFVNCALSSEDGMALVDRNTQADVHSRFEAQTGPPMAGPPSPELASVPVLSLGSFVQKYGITDAALKLDCEGEEYAIILSSDRGTLRKFSEIMVEFHYGYVDLAKKLESAGFSVKMVAVPDFRLFRKNRPLLVGMLHAIRK